MCTRSGVVLTNHPPSNISASRALLAAGMGATPHAPVGILHLVAVDSVPLLGSDLAKAGLGAAGGVAAEAAHKHSRRRGECVRSATVRFGLAKVPLLANGDGRPTRLVHLQGRRVGSDGRSCQCYRACVDEHFTVRWGLWWWRR